MRAHDSHVIGDGLTEAITGNPVTESRAPRAANPGPAHLGPANPEAAHLGPANPGPANPEAAHLGPAHLGPAPGPGFAPAVNVRVDPAAVRAGQAAGPGSAWCGDAVADRGQDAVLAQDAAAAADAMTARGAAAARGTSAAGAARDAGAAPDADAPRDTARRPGRPRSERAEQAIIDATIEALGSCGIDGVRCEDVAARAGVGKATLYRRWSGKEDLLIAAFAAMKHPLPEPRGESVRDDLVALLTVVAADADDPRFAQQYALLHGAGERYPRLVARYREQVVEPRREHVRAVLRHGVETGELRPGIDVEVAMLLLTGAVLARGKHDSTPAAPGFVAAAVDELLLGLAPR